MGDNHQQPRPHQAQPRSALWDLEPDSLSGIEGGVNGNHPESNYHSTDASSTYSFEMGSRNTSTRSVLATTALTSKQGPGTDTESDSTIVSAVVSAEFLPNDGQTGCCRSYVIEILFRSSSYYIFLFPPIHGYKSSFNCVQH